MNDDFEVFCLGVIESLNEQIVEEIVIILNQEFLFFNFYSNLIDFYVRNMESLNGVNSLERFEM